MCAQPHIAIVTTCSASKARAERGTVDLKEIPADLPPWERAKAWIERLERAPILPIAVEKLYQGPHWKQSVLAYENASRFSRVSLWVLSAGYGLVEANRNIRLKPYQATFSIEGSFGDNSNCVSPLGLSLTERTGYERAWWQALSDWEAPFGQSPRTLSRLVAEQEVDAMLVIASNNYLKVIETELKDAAASLAQPDRLIVISAGASNQLRQRLSGHMVQFDKRLAQRLGGALGSLNARTAAWLVEQLNFEKFTLSDAQRILDQTLADIPKEVRVARTPMSAEEVRAYLRAQPDIFEASATRLLWRFRREDLNSLEGKHFKRLVAEVKASLSSTPI